MIVNTQCPNHASRAVETEPSPLPLIELADDCPDDAFDADVAEIRRMVELSGMLGLECRLLKSESISLHDSL